VPTAFTDEEMKRIRSELIHAGIRLSKELGLQRMSVERLTSAVGIAKGSFYLFFGSKEDFILEVAEYTGIETQKMLLAKLNGRRQMSAHKFIEFFDEYLHSDLDLMNGLTFNDFLWIRKHLGEDYFDPNSSDYENTVLYIRLVKKLLFQSATGYRDRYELSTHRIDDMRLAIGYLSAQRRVELVMGNAEEGEEIKKKAVVWHDKLLGDQKSGLAK